MIGPAFPLRAAVFVLGVANGAFAVAAIGAMMGLVHVGRQGREGVRMGLWGAAQAVAFALGGLAGTLGSDVARALLGGPQAGLRDRVRRRGDPVPGRGGAGCGAVPRR